MQAYFNGMHFSHCYLNGVRCAFTFSGNNQSPTAPSGNSCVIPCYDEKHNFIGSLTIYNLSSGNYYVDSLLSQAVIPPELSAYVPVNPNEIININKNHKPSAPIIVEELSNADTDD